MGGCVTRRKHRAPRVLGAGTLATKLSRRAPRERSEQRGCKPACRLAGRVWRTFCRHGTNFNEFWSGRDTSMIGAVNLSPVTKLVACTGAVSRYKLSRSQKTVTMQDFNCEQMRALPDEALRSRVSGCKNHYKFVLGAGAKVEDPPTGGDEIPPWRGKNRDKQLTHIVRVSVSFCLFILSRYYSRSS